MDILGLSGFSHVFTSKIFWWIEGYQQLSIINGLNIGNFSPNKHGHKITGWIAFLAISWRLGSPAPALIKKNVFNLEKWDINGISTHNNYRMFTSAGIHTLNICDYHLNPPPNRLKHCKWIKHTLYIYKNIIISIILSLSIYIYNILYAYIYIYSMIYSFNSDNCICIFLAHEMDEKSIAANQAARQSVTDGALQLILMAWGALSQRL